jgi:hypothetical protein
MPISTAPPLTIQLFGPIDVQCHGAPLPRLRSRNGLWLLALLTLRHAREVDRAWLAGTLWPDTPTSQGLALLRRANVVSPNPKSKIQNPKSPSSRPALLPQYV